MEHFGVKAPVGGYPDDGNGYYSRKLSYKDWYVFNNWQRAHLNFLETFSIVVVMSFITAINQPLWAAVVGYVLVLGRIIYGLGYCHAGPKGRLVGAILWDLGLLAVFAGSIASLVQWTPSSAGSTFDPTSVRVLPISTVKFATLFASK